MTLRERVEQTANYVNHYERTHDQIVAEIEEAITTAVEEEREACAKLIDKQAQGMDALIAHAPTPLRAEDLKRLQHSLNVAAACVRTRADS